jgi:BASS family bile acid:Na+ symporter
MESTRQLLLTLIVLGLVFSVALDLKPADFQRVLHNRRSVVAGLVPQFLLLPVATWLATLVLDLPPSMEAAMILVAACPGGSLSNVITHLGRGNTALSVSISAVSAVIAMVMTPFNFAWMVGTNPATAQWMRHLDIDASGVLLALLVMLGAPMALGLFVGQRYPAAAHRLKKPLSKICMLALLAFVVTALMRNWGQLVALLPLPLYVVMAHNASGLLLGWLSARGFAVSEPDKRAIVVEGGMQNSSLALGIVTVQFASDLGMLIICSLWGIWHIVSGLTMVAWWRRLDRKAIAAGPGGTTRGASA